MSICKYSQGKYDECLNQARLTLKINPENIKCLYKISQIKLYRDLYDECQKTIDSIIKIDEKNI